MIVPIEKCYQCKGNEEECGKDISNMKNTTDSIQLVDCGIGDCWSYRRKENNIVTFERGCSHLTCTLSTFEENCKSVTGKKECSKCCKAEKCNTLHLDGSAKSNMLYLNSFLLFLSLICMRLTT